MLRATSGSCKTGSFAAASGSCDFRTVNLCGQITAEYVCVVQECPHKSVLQECPARVSQRVTKVSRESVPQERSTRVSPTRVSPTMFGCLFSSTCLHSGSWVPFFQTDFKHGAGIKQDAALESSVMELSPFGGRVYCWYRCRCSPCACSVMKSFLLTGASHAAPPKPCPFFAGVRSPGSLQAISLHICRISQRKNSIPCTSPMLQRREDMFVGNGSCW